MAALAGGRVGALRDSGGFAADRRRCMVATRRPAAEPRAVGRQKSVKAAEALAALAEVSVSLAGFSGIVTAFRRHNRDEWSQLDRFRFRFMVEFSLVALALSLFPFFLSELRLPESEVWSFSSFAPLGGVAWCSSGVLSREPPLRT
jgi:hypothetical protein